MKTSLLAAALAMAVSGAAAADDPKPVPAPKPAAAPQTAVSPTAPAAPGPNCPAKAGACDPATCPCPNCPSKAKLKAAAPVVAIGPATVTRTFSTSAVPAGRTVVVWHAAAYPQRAVRVAPLRRLAAWRDRRTHSYRAVAVTADCGCGGLCGCSGCTCGR